MARWNARMNDMNSIVHFMCMRMFLFPPNQHQQPALVSYYRRIWIYFVSYSIIVFTPISSESSLALRQWLVMRNLKNVHSVSLCWLWMVESGIRILSTINKYQTSVVNDDTSTKKLLLYVLVVAIEFFRRILFLRFAFIHKYIEVPYQ